MAYVIQLAGLDLFVGVPFAGIIGLLALVRFSRGGGPRAAFGRAGLCVVVTNLLTFASYWYQSGRFLLPSGAILGVAAAAFVAGRFGFDRSSSDAA